MKLHASILLVSLCAAACRPSAPAQPCPLQVSRPEAPVPMAAPEKVEPSPPKEPPLPETETPSLHLSILPQDTMAVALVRDLAPLSQALDTALDQPPASLRRSLPLATRFPLLQLGHGGMPTFSFAAPPMAVVWDAKQRALWIWKQHDLSLHGRLALEKELGASTRFSAPYWILERPEDPLEYFVHAKAQWLVACPKAFAPQVRAWLHDSSPSELGRLSWAPSPMDQGALVMRWRSPQLLESAPSAELGVIGELRIDASGLRINGASRTSP